MEPDKSTVNDTIKSAKTGTIEKEFLKDFISYWRVIKDHRVRDIDKIKETCQLLYDEYTKPFVDKWEKHFESVRSSEIYAKSHFSFEFTCPTGMIIIIPEKILVFESLKPKTTTFDYIEKISSLKEFLFYFEKTLSEGNFPLSDSDMRILRVLASNKFTGISDESLDTDELSKLCNCSKQTFWSRIKRLDDIYILDFIPQLDTARLGYETL